jgi:hypothetical protein
MDMIAVAIPRFHTSPCQDTLQTKFGYTARYSNQIHHIPFSASASARVSWHSCLYWIMNGRDLQSSLSTICEDQRSSSTFLRYSIAEFLSDCQHYCSMMLTGQDTFSNIHSQQGVSFVHSMVGFRSFLMINVDTAVCVL